MSNVKINGIVIAENNMGDYDKMLTILTPNYGKISCVAKEHEDHKVLFWQVHNYFVSVNT